jgi:hypothetical protein
MTRFSTDMAKRIMLDGECIICSDFSACLFQLTSRGASARLTFFHRKRPKSMRCGCVTRILPLPWEWTHYMHPRRLLEFCLSVASGPLSFTVLTIAAVRRCRAKYHRSRSRAKAFCARRETVSMYDGQVPSAGMDTDIRSKREI